jgi:hypothetical protein
MLSLEGFRVMGDVPEKNLSIGPSDFLFGKGR